MQHIVINYQQRRQYLLIFIATIIFSFGLGYWFGYHSNSSGDMTTAITQMENLRRQNDRSLNNESYTSDWSGELASEKPVAEAKSAADNSVVAKTNTQQPTVIKPVAVVTPVKPMVKPVVAPVTPPVIKPVIPAPVQAPVQPVIVKPVVAPAAVTPPIPPTATPVTTSESITNTSLSAESANTQYTVQAGVFDSRENAMKLVNELNAKGFDAYVDEITANTGEVKFNVRFGRSNDRDQVQKRLVRFKQLYTTAAYIITLEK